MFNQRSQRVSQAIVVPPPAGLADVTVAVACNALGLDAPPTSLSTPAEQLLFIAYALMGKFVLGCWPHCTEGVVFEVSCAAGVVRFGNPSSDVSHMEAIRTAFYGGE